MIKSSITLRTLNYGNYGKYPLSWVMQDIYIYIYIYICTHHHHHHQPYYLSGFRSWGSELGAQEHEELGSLEAYGSGFRGLGVCFRGLGV